MPGRPTLDIDDEKTRFVRDVEHELLAFLESKKNLISEISPDSVEMVEAIAELSMRGGKRFRPQISFASFYAVSADALPPSLPTLGACLEMLQTYLLIHDDWMDGDSVRRGGPAVHAYFAERYASQHLGASVGVIAGDMACTWAWELFQQVNFPDAQKKPGQAQFALMQNEVYCGQHLDVTNNSNVSRMHLLKTASYSTQSPALLGALMGNANEAQLSALREWGMAIGQAFQLRDDLISTFGNTELTGKPANEIDRNKHNAVFETFLKTAEPKTRDAYETILKSSVDDIEKRRRLLTMLRDAQVTSEIEKQIAVLTERGLKAITQPIFLDKGRVLLSQLTEAIANRQS